MIVRDVWRKMMKNGITKKITAILISIAVLILGAIIILDAKKNNTPQVEATGFAMGSVISVTLYGTDDDSVAQEIFDAISEEETKYISRYKDTSEIYKLNELGTMTVSEHTADILKKAVEISDNSNGAFDITVGALSSLWNFDDDTHIIPDKSSINTALEACGYEKITFNGNEFTLSQGQQLDLGAMGKGIGCDIALEILKNHPEVSGAVVSVGGTILTYGENPESEVWIVGIRSPEKDNSSVFMTVKVEGTKFISTSGNYEKCFEESGVLYHHILSPRTGYPVTNELKSVTVIADSGLLADALSTACYVSGVKSSSKIIDEYSVDSIFIDNSDNVISTENYYEAIRIINSDSVIYSYESSYEEYSLVYP